MYNWPMSEKIMRSLIYLFSGLIVLFILLILINRLGSLAGARTESAVPGKSDAPRPGEAGAMAQQALAAARYNSSGMGSFIPAFRQGLSSSSVRSDGSIMLVKEKDFGGVAEPPVDMLTALNELGGGNKNKPSPVVIDQNDMKKKIYLPPSPGKAPRLDGAAMPELGRGPGQEGTTMIHAPVDYKVFTSSETWWAFANSRKLKCGPHDFSSSNLVILISLSDFPSGIFVVTSVKPGKNETVVSYRINPLAMASGATDDQRAAYARAPVPKGPPIRLLQVP